ncbi:MAG: sensor histidine kinase [Anaerolineae bacterium]
MTIDAVTIGTLFAPAERADNDVIRQQALKFASHPLMCEMLNAVPDIVVVLNQQRQIVFANQVLYDYLQPANPEMLLGLRPGEALQCIHSTETGGGCGTTEFCSTCGAVKAILQAQRGKNSVKECRITREVNGVIEAVDFRVWATPFKMDDEQYTIFAVVDISDEKRRRILERIFFHDITNTAGAIRALAEMADTIANDDASDFEFGELLSQASLQLIDEIEAQRQLMAAENGDLVPEFGKVDSLVLLQNIVDLYRNHIVSQDRTIRLHPKSEAFSMQTDRALLGRVIGNMIKNALEAVKPGEKVTVGCDRHGCYARFWVQNPSFMPRHVQLQVFQRSFSTKGSSRGLGTYSMKLLSERYLNGTVSFRSSPEKGTVFVAMYPLG